MRLLQFLVLNLIVCMAIGCASANVARKRFTKGMYEISVGGTAGTHLISNDLVDKASTFALSPLYGYFLTDKLEVLGALGIEYEEVKYKESTSPLAIDYTRQSNYSLATGIQYNFNAEAQTVPFFRLFAGIMNSRIEARQINIPVIGVAKDERRTTDPYFGVRLGIRHFIAENISCDVGLGWQRVLYSSDFGDDTNDFSLIVGGAFFF